MSRDGSRARRGLGPLLLAVLLVAALATVPASAGASQATQPEICNREATTLVSTYNENIEDVPGLVRGRVSNTVVHGVVKGSAGGDYTFETDAKGRVEGYSEGTPNDATVRVITDCDSFTELTDSENTVDAFWREYRRDDINFVGVGLVRSLVVDGTEIVVSLGDRITGATPLGFYEATALSGGIILLGVVAALLVCLYVVYRVFTILRMRRMRAGV